MHIFPIYYSEMNVLKSYKIKYSHAHIHKAIEFKKKMGKQWLEKKRKTNERNEKKKNLETIQYLKHETNISKLNWRRQKNTLFFLAAYRYRLVHVIRAQMKKKTNDEKNTATTTTTRKEKREKGTQDFFSWFLFRFIWKSIQKRKKWNFHYLKHKKM